MLDRDSAMGKIVEVLGIISIIGAAMIPAISQMEPALHNDVGEKIERDRVRQDLETILGTGDRWCCPDDPSAPSRLQDAATAAWLAEGEEFEALFVPWLSAPESTKMLVRMGWQPANGEPLQRVPLYGPQAPDGPSVGAQRWIQPAQRGPAYLVPRLENVSTDASADVHFLPISKWWPYQQGPDGKHADWLHTKIFYKPTTEGSGTIPTVLEHHDEIAGTPSPAIDVRFEEPDWAGMMGDSPIEIEGTNDTEFRLALTKEDLSAERLLDGDEATSDETGIYAHHRFHINVKIRGDTTRNLTALVESRSDWTADQETSRYRISVDVPRKWTDVNFTGQDPEDNNRAGWTSPSIDNLSDDAGHRVTAVLNDTINYTVATKEGPQGRTQEVKVELEEDVEAPFTFHARPPAETEQTVAGFQKVRATVTAGPSATSDVRGGASLGVELINDAGRLHRSFETHAPQHWPPLGFGGTDRTVEVPIGASFFNGGEATEIRRIVWQAPEGSFADASVNDTLTTFDFATSGEWAVRDEGSVLEWRGSAECPELEACTIATRVAVDGSALEPTKRWDPPRTVALYEEDDVRSYVDWFIRSTRAWNGAPASHGPPGFALASRATGALGGEVEGGFLWRLAPSTEPICDESDVRERDRASGARDGDRTRYSFGPREDGIPVVGTRIDDGEDACSAGLAANRSFMLVGQAGARWDVDAVGHASYRSVDGLSRSTFSSWRNGLAESRVVGPNEVSPGSAREFTVQVDGLFERLLDQGIKNVTVKAFAYDPYNAWEQRPWWENLLWREGEPYLEETELPDDDQDDPFELWHHDPCGVDDCPDAPDEVGSQDPVPSKFDLELGIPHRVLPGTHLLVVEVSWQANTDTGETFRETGRVLKPFDVLFEGAYAMPTMIEGVAWGEDWG